MTSILPDYIPHVTLNGVYANYFLRVSKLGKENCIYNIPAGVNHLRLLIKNEHRLSIYYDMKRKRFIHHLPEGETCFNCPIDPTKTYSINGMFNFLIKYSINSLKNITPVHNELWKGEEKSSIYVDINCKASRVIFHESPPKEEYQIIKILSDVPKYIEILISPSNNIIFDTEVSDFVQYIPDMDHMSSRVWAYKNKSHLRFDFVTYTNYSFYFSFEPEQTSFLHRFRLHH